MTIEKARELLGPTYQDLSDELIQGMIDLFRLYSTLAISQHISRKRKLIKDSYEAVNS